MDVRRAARRDMDGVLELQAASFIGNLSAEDRKGGFVSVEFTRNSLTRWQQMTRLSSPWSASRWWATSVRRASTTVDSSRC